MMVLIVQNAVKLETISFDFDFSVVQFSDLIYEINIYVVSAFLEINTNLIVGKNVQGVRLEP